MVLRPPPFVGHFVRDFTKKDNFSQYYPTPSSASLKDAHVIFVYIYVLFSRLSSFLYAYVCFWHVCSSCVSYFVCLCVVFMYECVCAVCVCCVCVF